MNDECYLIKVKMLLWPRLSRTEIHSILSDLNSERENKNLLEIYGRPEHFSKTLIAEEKKRARIYAYLLFSLCILILFAFFIKCLSENSLTVSSMGVVLLSWLMYVVLSGDDLLPDIRKVSGIEKKKFWAVYALTTVLEICAILFCSVYSLTYRRNIFIFSVLLICVTSLSLYSYIAKQEPWMFGICIRSIDLIIMFGLGRMIHGTMTEIYDVGTWIWGIVAGNLLSVLLYMRYLKGRKNIWKAS